MKNIIEIKNLTKFYGKHKGVENINLNVDEGEIFGFIGPNGAGKSTTIRTMLSLIHATSGDVKIFGKDITKEGEDIRKEIGYLPSEVFYYDDMKVIDLLKYSASFYNKDCTKKIKELSKELELDLNKKIEDLSYGNKKKVGIVQGLLHEPKLIILDEPTGGLDPLMQHRFFDILEKENNRGTTIFFSSHILSEVQRMCSRVAIIKDGAIVKIEEMATISNNNYKKFKVTFNNNKEANQFKSFDATNLNVDENVVTFLYKKDINNVIESISKYKINDLLITEPDLEEIFMHYYK